MSIYWQNITTMIIYYYTDMSCMTVSVACFPTKPTPRRGLPCTKLSVPWRRSCRVDWYHDRSRPRRSIASLCTWRLRLTVRRAREGRFRHLASTVPIRCSSRTLERQLPMSGVSPQSLWGAAPFCSVGTPARVFTKRYRRSRRSCGKLAPVHLDRGIFLFWRSIFGFFF